MTGPAHPTPSLSLRLYARLLELYPSSFLQRHRAEMLQNFADLEDAAGSAAKLWFLIGKDLTMSLSSHFSTSRLGRTANGVCIASAALFAIGYLFHGPGPTAQAKDWSKLTIAVPLGFMPYTGRDAAGRPIGFDIDLANNLCARMKATCTVENHSFGEVLIAGLNAGNYDAIMGAVSITHRRLEEIDFSRPYAREPVTFMVQKDSPLAKMPPTRVSLDDGVATEALVKELTPYLKGKKIGVWRWSNTEDLANTYFKGIGAQVVTTQEVVLKLWAGQLDTTMSFRSLLVSVLAEPGYDRLTLAGPQMTGGPLGHGLGVGLRKRDTDLKDLFNKAIGEAQADGTLKRLSLQWFKTDITPPI